MEFTRIGFQNLVRTERIISVVSPEAAPVKRLVQEARDRGALIDASAGRKTRSVLVMDSDHIILSALTPAELERSWIQPEPTGSSLQGESEAFDPSTTAR